MLRRQRITPLHLSLSPDWFGLHYSLRTRPVTPAMPNVMSNQPTPMWIHRYTRKNLTQVTVDGLGEVSEAGSTDDAGRNCGGTRGRNCGRTREGGLEDSGDQ